MARPIVLGVAGDSGAAKTTLTRGLIRVMGDEQVVRISAAMKDAAAQGRGAVSLDGRLIDAASIRMAPTLLAKLEQIDARGDAPGAVADPLGAERAAASA